MRDSARHAEAGQLRCSIDRWLPYFHLETVANLLKLLECVSTILSKCALKSLYNQAGFDSAIRRFDPSRPKRQCAAQIKGRKRFSRLKNPGSARGSALVMTQVLAVGT
ncbi:MAG: hypothetical protein QHD01_27080 [Bradyrhizobium sp.]|uniref:hypothetical protein n=1 Tax=Bradyrhizobium sp. TaxID=376 RepID=UPI0029A29560|nr:hypothetical protein [Bradyrhizobium sp.]MDX3970242.1 hypothetical protein [Bradyrhizobium sp.]